MGERPFEHCTDEELDAILIDSATPSEDRLAIVQEIAYREVRNATYFGGLMAIIDSSDDPDDVSARMETYMQQVPPEFRGSVIEIYGMLVDLQRHFQESPPEIQQAAKTTLADILKNPPISIEQDQRQKMLALVSHYNQSRRLGLQADRAAYFPPCPPELHEQMKALMDFVDLVATLKNPAE